MTVNVHKRRRYTVRRISRAPAAAGRLPEASGSRRLYALLTVVSAAGVLTGALAFGRGDGYSPAAPVGFMPDFMGSLAVMFMYVGICFFAGLSCAGEPAGYLLCLFKGMGTGYLAMSVSGNTALALGVLPFEAVSMVTVILAARENIRLSRFIFGKAFSRAGNKAAGGIPSGYDGASCLKLYFAKFGVLLLASCGAALLDGLMSVLAAA